MKGSAFGVRTTSWRMVFQDTMEGICLADVSTSARIGGILNAKAAYRMFSIKIKESRYRANKPGFGGRLITAGNSSAAILATGNLVLRK